MPQPLKWKSPIILRRRGLKWIKEQNEKGEPVTVTGLAIALDGTRTMLDEYAQREEYADVIAELKNHCEHYAEMKLFKAQNPSGAIFALKQYGWHDKQELEVSANQKITTIGLILKGIEEGNETKYFESGKFEELPPIDEKESEPTNQAKT